MLPFVSSSGDDNMISVGREWLVNDRDEDDDSAFMLHLISLLWRVFDGEDSVLGEWKISELSFFALPPAAWSSSIRFFVFKHEITRVGTVDRWLFEAISGRILQDRQWPCCIHLSLSCLEFRFRRWTGAYIARNKHRG